MFGRALLFDYRIHYIEGALDFESLMAPLP